jgi:mannose-6-phosphate isomerase
MEWEAEPNATGLYEKMGARRAEYMGTRESDSRDRRVMRPIELGPNQFPRFYRGGPRIAAFRGLPQSAENTPEDWIASTTHAYGEENGPSRLPDGTALADAMAAAPDEFFEPEHVARFGPHPEVLIKLLDAGERLPVHFHPDAGFARAHLGSNHGKTEAWIIVEADAGAAVWVGFAREVEEDELARWVDEQDVDAMLGAMNRIGVAPDDEIFVPAGVAHAIGEGILLLELQEPSDLSLLLEGDRFLDLPRELALTAVQRYGVPVERGLPPDSERFFRAEWVEAGATLEPAFSVLVVTKGEGALDEVDVRRGSTILVPYAAGACELRGDVRAIRCRPPNA